MRSKKQIDRRSRDGVEDPVSGSESEDDTSDGTLFESLVENVEGGEQGEESRHRFSNLLSSVTTFVISH